MDQIQLKMITDMKHWWPLRSYHHIWHAILWLCGDINWPHCLCQNSRRV